MNSMSQNTDHKLKEMFQSWGEEPAVHAWASITHTREQRALERRKRKRRIILAFFSGSMLMAILLLPFILLKQETVNTATNNADVLSIPYGVKSGDPQDLRHPEKNNVPGKGIQVFSSKSFSKSSQVPAENSKARTELTSSLLSFSKPVPLSGLPARAEQAPEENTGMRIRPLTTYPYNYNLRSSTADMPYRMSLYRPPVKQLSGYMLNLQVGRTLETSRMDQFSGEGTAHKDARENYGKWLTAAKSGVSFTAELSKSFRGEWQVQSGFNYVDFEQRVHYDYTLRDVPVFWNGKILGYIPLHDSQASVYKFDQVNYNQRLTFTLGIGKQLLQMGRMRLTGFIYAAPYIINGNTGSVLNLNKNAFESIRKLVQDKNMPFGYSARCSYTMKNGMQMFIQYGRTSARQFTRISGADINTTIISNKISLGLQYPFFKK
jgi:hypothetical protein